MRGPKYPVKLTEEERIVLEQMLRNPTTEQLLVQRAQIILLAGTGMKHQGIAESISASQVGRILKKKDLQPHGKTLQVDLSGRCPVLVAFIFAVISAAMY